MKKVLITAPVHPLLQPALEERGYTVHYAPDLDYGGLLLAVPDVHGLVVTTRLRIDKTMLNRASNLKWIGRLGAGMELIDAAHAATLGIRCISTPEGNRGAVGEHTLGLALSLLRRIHSAYEEVKTGKWLRAENRGIELSGKTVGIIGYGNAGSAFARVLAGFDVTVLAHDKYKQGYGGGYVQEATLEQVVQESDLLSLHLPLTAETAHYANDGFFDALRKAPLFLTTCRGGVTDTAALLRALHSRKVSGAGLDVLENEKLSAYTADEQSLLEALTALPQVLITPHIAGYTHEAYRKMAETLLAKLEELGVRR